MVGGFGARIQGLDTVAIPAIPTGSTYTTIMEFRHNRITILIMLRGPSSIIVGVHIDPLGQASKGIIRPGCASLEQNPASQEFRSKVLFRVYSSGFMFRVYIRPQSVGRQLQSESWAFASRGWEDRLVRLWVHCKVLTNILMVVPTPYQ